MIAQVQYAVSPVTWLFPLVLVGLLATFLLARKRAWILILAIPLALVVLGFLAFLFVGQPTMVSSQTATVSFGSFPRQQPVYEMPPQPPTSESSPLAETPPSPEQPPVEPPTPNFEDELYADKYPSEKAGATALTRRILESLDKLIPTGTKLGALTIEGNGQASPEILAAMADAARARLPGVNIGLKGVTNAPNQNDASLTLRVLVIKQHIPPTAEIRATLLRPGANDELMTDQVRTENKPWVQGFESAASHGQIRFVVHSDLCTSQNEAENKARALAIDRLRRIIQNRLGAEFTAGHIHPSEKSWLFERLEHSFYCQDRFDRQITRSYGKLYQQSLLVTVPESEIAEMADSCQRSLLAQRAGWRHTLFSAAGLALGIVVLYLFLNAATKGYYMWPLRLFGAVAAAAGVLIVLRMA